LWHRRGTVHHQVGVRDALVSEKGTSEKGTDLFKSSPSPHCYTYHTVTRT
jgi:hypothetical protein